MSASQILICIFRQTQEFLAGRTFPSVLHVSKRDGNPNILNILRLNVSAAFQNITLKQKLRFGYAAIESTIYRNESLFRTLKQMIQILGRSHLNQYMMQKQD